MLNDDEFSNEVLDTLDFIKRTFVEQGELRPMGIGIKKEGWAEPGKPSRVVMGFDTDFMNTSEAKQFLSEKLKAFCRLKDLDLFMFMHEVWYLELRGMDEEAMKAAVEWVDKNGVRNHPNKTEVVFMTISSKRKEQSKAIVYDIIRGDGTVSLAEKHLEVAGRFEGKFCNLIEEIS